MIYLETMRVSISFWEELIHGNLHYFYGGRWQQTSAAYVKEVQAVYDFPIYIVFAIWNFPIWLVEHFGKVDVMNSVLCMMWEKNTAVSFGTADYKGALPVMSDIGFERI